MGRLMMAHRMMVKEHNNKCPYCGTRLTDISGNWIIHDPYNCDKNPEKLLAAIEALKLKKNLNE